MEDNELLRYSRQIMLKQIGIEAQQKLLNSKVLIVGAGGLGCFNSLYLAGSGVGEMLIVDNDKIEISNLPRQILFNDNDIGKYKAETAAQQLKKQFLNLKFSYINDLFSADIISKFNPDIIIDSGDNLDLTNYIADIAESKSIPVVYASVNRMEGYIYTYIPNSSFPSVKKLFPSVSDSETCSQLGVMTVAVGVISSLQSMQVIRVLLRPDLGEIKPILSVFDGINMKFMDINV